MEENHQNRDQVLDYKSCREQEIGNIYEVFFLKKVKLYNRQFWRLVLEFLKQNHIHSASKLYLIYYLNSTFKIYLSQPESPEMCVRAYVYFIIQVRNGNCSFSCTLDPTSGKHWRSTLWKCISVNLRLTLSTSCSHHEEYLGTEYSIPPFTTKHRLLESHPGWNSPHY